MTELVPAPMTAQTDSHAAAAATTAPDSERRGAHERPRQALRRLAALNDVNLEVSAARSSCCSASPAPASRRCCATSTASSSRPPATIEVLGQEFPQLTGRALAPLRSRVGFVFQQFELVRSLTRARERAHRRARRPPRPAPRPLELPARTQARRARPPRPRRPARPRLPARRHPLRRSAAARRHRPRAHAEPRDPARRRARRLARPRVERPGHGAHPRDRRRQGLTVSAACTRSTSRSPGATASSASATARSCSTPRPPAYKAEVMEIYGRVATTTSRARGHQRARAAVDAAARTRRATAEHAAGSDRIRRGHGARLMRTRNAHAAARHRRAGRPRTSPGAHRRRSSPSCWCSPRRIVVVRRRRHLDPRHVAQLGQRRALLRARRHDRVPAEPGDLLWLDRAHPRPRAHRHPARRGALGAGRLSRRVEHHARARLARRRPLRRRAHPGDSRRRARDGLRAACSRSVRCPASSPSASTRSA